jgi:hypothetical protein
VTGSTRRTTGTTIVSFSLSWRLLDEKRANSLHQITDFNDDIRASPEVDRDPDFDYTAFSGWEYQPRWVLAFRDGTRVAIQATLRTSTARKECDAIAKSIRSALVVTGA